MKRMIFVSFLCIWLKAGIVQSLSSIDQDTRNEVRALLNELHLAQHASRSLVKEVVRAHLAGQFNSPVRSPRCNRHHVLITLASQHGLSQKFNAMVDEEIERKLDEVYGALPFDPIEKIAQVFRLNTTPSS